MGLLEKIRSVPIGYSEVCYLDKKYGVTRTDCNGGRSHKIYAEELGGTNFISLNYYITATSESLKPCEMPEHKAIHFLNNYKLGPVNTKQK